MISLFKKKVVVPPAAKKIAVHCSDGQIVVHFATYRTIKPNGSLCLHNAKDGSNVIADYAPGAWTSLTVGTRKVSKK